MNIRLTKVDAAVRQLTHAINSFFLGHDLVVVHTLVGAAGNILHDLVEAKIEGSSLESKIASDSDVTLKEALAEFRKTQNFLKHADRDATSVLELSSQHTEDIIYFVTHNLVELKKTDAKIHIPVEISAFQLWYHAIKKNMFDDKPHDLDQLLVEYYPDDIDSKPKSEQIKAGLANLHRMRLELGVTDS